MPLRGSLINPYRFYGDKRALNRKLTATGRLYRSVTDEPESKKAVEWSQPFTNPTVVSASIQSERISCRAPNPLTVKRPLAKRISMTIRKLLKEFW